MLGLGDGDFCPQCQDAVAAIASGACPHCGAPCVLGEAPRPALSWWQQRRSLYNGVLVAAVPNALLVDSSIIALLGHRNPQGGGEPLSLLFGAFAFGLMMLLANLCYGLGPLLERRLPATWRPRYRQRAFVLGCLFSIAVPHVVPLLHLCSLLGAALP